MSKHKGPWVVALLVTLFIVACTHKPPPHYEDAVAPFSNTRDQTVALVAHAKRSLGAADLNTLSVTYTPLEEKANAYASFMVEAVEATSFDSSRNGKYAGDLATAIVAFDKSYDKLMASRQSPIASAWVPSFAQSLQAQWNQYNGAIAKMSPQQKADLTTTLKRLTVWPNYEDIATEPVNSHP